MNNLGQSPFANEKSAHLPEIKAALLQRHSKTHKPSFFEREINVKISCVLLTTISVITTGFYAASLIKGKSLRAAKIVVASGGLIASVFSAVFFFFKFFQKEFWNDPQFLAKRGVEIATNIQKQRYNYNDIEANYGDEITKHNLLQFSDLAELISPRIKEALTYNEFISKNKNFPSEYFSEEQKELLEKLKERSLFVPIYLDSEEDHSNDIEQQKADNEPAYEVKSIFEIAELYNDLPENEGIYFKNGNHYNLDCLAQLIGKERFTRICARPELDIYFDSEGASLKKQNLRKIFIGMLDLRREDYRGSPEEAYSFNSEKELNGLFLNQIPSISPIDKAKTSGKGLQGLAERVYIQGLHHLYVKAHKDETAKFICDGEMLTSRLADREMQEGSILHLSDGYFVVDKIFIAGGAYVSALQDLNDPTRTKLVCRGTAMRYSATGGLLSGLNDLLVDVGLMGTKSVWPSILAYLQEKGIKETEIFGKSLGGAHAQQLAVLVEGIAKIPVTKLTTFGAVGTTERVHQLFNEVREKQNHEIKISVIRNGGAKEMEHDFIPTVGGMHLGVDTPKSKVTVYYLNENQEPSVPFSGSIGIVAAKQFLSSFGIAHCRQVTLQQFNWTEISEPEAVKKQLAMGTYLDPYRKIMASALDYATLGYLNGSLFDQYYEEQLNSV